MQKLVALAVLFLSSSVIGAEKSEGDKQEQGVATQAPLKQDTEWSSATTIYDFHARDIHGNDVSLDKYRGHVCLIVNVASNCGLTDQNYKELVQLYEKYSQQEGLRILAFPSNQFAGQEPGTSEEILEFVKKYNVKFDLFEKIDVNGDNAHPLYKWLKAQAGEPKGEDIGWNFAKFIINKEGKVVSRREPKVTPLELENDLKTYF